MNQATVATIEQPTSEVGAEGRIPAGQDRLAELVVHLTDCAPALAIAAVQEAATDEALATPDDRLLVIARAMVSVKQGIDLRG